MKLFWKATLVRALRSFCQALVSMIPAGIVVTPVMVQSLDWSFIYVILAWIGTALLHSLSSVITSIATGLPEVEWEHQKYMDIEPPDDAEVNEDDD